MLYQGDALRAVLALPLSWRINPVPDSIVVEKESWKKSPKVLREIIFQGPTKPVAQRTTVRCGDEKPGVADDFARAAAEFDTVVKACQTPKDAGFCMAPGTAAFNSVRLAAGLAVAGAVVNRIGQPTDWKSAAAHFREGFAMAWMTLCHAESSLTEQTLTALGDERKKKHSPAEWRTRLEFVRTNILAEGGGGAQLAEKLSEMLRATDLDAGTQKSVLDGAMVDGCIEPIVEALSK